MAGVECRKIAKRFANAILGQEVAPYELVITGSISKVPSERTVNTLEASASSQLAEAGLELHAGKS